MWKKYNSWIPGIVFWVLFLGSLLIGKRYWWVDTVWSVVWLTFLGVIAICAAVGFFRGGGENGAYVSHRGVPRWAVALFGGEVEERSESAKHAGTQRRMAND